MRVSGPGMISCSRTGRPKSISRGSSAVRPALVSILIALPAGSSATQRASRWAEEVEDPLHARSRLRREVLVPQEEPTV
jgi:hypothetical protein